MEAARTLKANLKLEGKPCGWCNAALALGDDASVCNTCEKEHHQGCWDNKAGCSTQGCASAPLRRLDTPAAPGAPRSRFSAAPELAPGMIACPRCGLQLTAGTQLCPGCRAITSPDGLYNGPKTNAPGAVASLVLGILGLVLCGIIMGPLAISQAKKARDAIDADPSYGGAGLATAGKVLGIISIVVFVIGIIARAAMMSNGSRY